MIKYGHKPYGFQSMPIDNIIKSQEQGKLFGYKLKEELNPNNKLYKLRELINWSRLEEWLSKNVCIKKFGRNIANTEMFLPHIRKNLGIDQ
ncbi:hypothetical protein [Rickettsia endosymbiont of Urophora cardui]|uniref:hypothetical protein n=1 Tax=Rickettsia endosymbiont of Urophora cardui TaxID=3066265 RepID=UPI00313CA719